MPHFVLWLIEYSGVLLSLFAPNETAKLLTSHFFLALYWIKQTHAPGISAFQLFGPPELP